MVRLVCENGHEVVKEVLCPDCNAPLVWAGRDSGKQNVAVCEKGWQGKGRNWIVRDILRSLNLKDCPKCHTSHLSFLKKI